VAAVDDVMDIAQILGDAHLEALTSKDTATVFWFSPALCRRVNPAATELLLAATSFSARTVPLLRGDIFITSHNSAGNVVGLSQHEINRLLFHRPDFWETRFLGRRFVRDRDHQRRLAQAMAPTGPKCDSAWWAGVETRLKRNVSALSHDVFSERIS
jgi:hypothetical protein